MSMVLAIRCQNPSSIALDYPQKASINGLVLVIVHWRSSVLNSVGESGLICYQFNSFLRFCYNGPSEIIYPSPHYVFIMLWLLYLLSRRIPHKLTVPYTLHNNYLPILLFNIIHILIPFSLKIYINGVQQIRLSLVDLHELFTMFIPCF